MNILSEMNEGDTMSPEDRALHHRNSMSQHTP